MQVNMTRKKTRINGANEITRTIKNGVRTGKNGKNDRKRTERNGVSVMIRPGRNGIRIVGTGIRKGR
jgi:hypothetical protein